MQDLKGPKFIEFFMEIKSNLNGDLHYRENKEQAAIEKIIESVMHYRTD